MKKFLAMLCAVALAALCAVSAFAEATPGQAANELATNILNTANKGIMLPEAVEMTEHIAANPTIPVTKEQANKTPPDTYPNSRPNAEQLSGSWNGSTTGTVPDNRSDY